MAHIDDLVRGFEEEVVAATEARRGKGGQHVPFFGDFCSAPPSTLSRLAWWAREFRRALRDTPPPDPGAGEKGEM